MKTVAPGAGIAVFQYLLLSCHSQEPSEKLQGSSRVCTQVVRDNSQTTYFLIGVEQRRIGCSDGIQELMCSIPLLVENRVRPYLNKPSYGVRPFSFFGGRTTTIHAF
jgi:hypothetical protein